MAWWRTPQSKPGSFWFIHHTNLMYSDGFIMALNMNLNNF